MLVGQDVSHPCARSTNFSTLSTVGTVMHGVFLSNLWPVAYQANLELSKARAGAEETSRKLSEQAPPLHMNVIGLGGFWMFLATTKAVEPSLEMNKLWTCEEQTFRFSPSRSQDGAGDNCVCVCTGQSPDRGTQQIGRDLCDFENKKIACFVRNMDASA